MGFRWIVIAVTLVVLGRVATAEDSISEVVKACDDGKVEACLEAGRRLETVGGPKEEKSVNFYIQACALGSAYGCFTAGYRLTKGVHAPRDPARGRALLEKSCGLNNASGCLKAGDAFLTRWRGAGVNVQEAVRYYLRACALDEASACEQLGALYEEGTEMPKDLTAAITHWDASCQLGSKGGCERAKRLRETSSSGSDAETVVPASPAPAAFRTENGSLVLPSPIVFKLSSSELLPEAAAGLDHVVAYLNAKPHISLVRIEGHFETATTTRPLQQITEERALVVARALVDRGIDCNRLLAVGFGASKPIADNVTPEGRAINRRIVVVNAALNGKPIGGMPVEGGGTVAGSVCTDSQKSLPANVNVRSVDYDDYEYGNDADDVQESAPLGYAAPRSSIRVDRTPPVERRTRGYSTLSPLGVGVAGTSRPAFALNVAFAIGHQISPRFGLDLLASGSVIGTVDLGQQNIDNAFSAYASVLVGPRFRRGSKRNGFIGVTPGLSYLAPLKGAAAEDATGVSGAGLRIEWHNRRKVGVYGEAHLHADPFVFVGFAAGL